MAEEAKPEVVAQVSDTVDDEAAKDMDVETLDKPEQTDDGDATVNGGKRPREEGAEPEEEEEENGGEEKKLKVEKSVEEERLEKSSDSAADDGGEKGTETVSTGPVTVGLKSFDTSVEMFDYFYKHLHFWPPYFNVNKYEHIMLLDLLKKGHVEAENKIKSGVSAFQVRYHPEFKSRCYFLVREDGSFDDFSFRKCVDHILALPENMQLKPEVNKALGGGRSGGGGRGGRGNWRGRGRGRGGKPRN